MPQKPREPEHVDEDAGLVHLKADIFAKLTKKLGQDADSKRHLLIVLMAILEVLVDLRDAVMVAAQIAEIEDEPGPDDGAAGTE